VAAVGCLLVFQVLDGGLMAEVSLGMTAVLAALLMWQCLHWGSRAALGGSTSLNVARVLFGVGLAACAASAISIGGRAAASLDPAATTVEVILLVGMAVAFLIGVIVGRSDNAAVFVVKALVWAGAALAIWSLFAFADPSGGGLRGPRLEAGYQTPNTAGTVFAAFLVLAVAMLSRRVRKAASRAEGWWRTVLWAIPVLVAGAALLATASRGGAFAAAAGLVVFFVSQLWRPGASTSGRLALVATGAVLAMMIVWWGGYLLQRLSVHDVEMNGRAELFHVHWNAFLQRPLRGYGLGTFDIVNKLNLNADNFRRLWSIRAAHNLFLQWLEEGGLVAAGAMGLSLLTVLGIVVQGALRRRTVHRVLWALVAVDVVMLVHGLSDFALQTPAVAALWALMLGLQVGLSLEPISAEADLLGRAPGHAVFAGLAIAASLTALYALQVGGEARVGGVRLMGLASGYDRQADRLLADGHTAPALAQARLASQRALQASPHDVSAQLRLAYIDSLGPRGLTPQGAAMVERSYALSPLDQAVGVWRIRFALTYWEQLSPKTQTMARAEFDALRSTRSHRKALLRVLREIPAGQGAMVAQFWIARVNRTPV
jgi:O-antigen ligase